MQRSFGRSSNIWSNSCSLRFWVQNWLNNQLETDNRIIWHNEMLANQFASSFQIKTFTAICISASGVKLKGKIGCCKELVPSQSTPCLLATSTRWLTRCSSFVPLFDLLERHHNEIICNCCLMMTMPLSFTPSQNIMQSLQKLRDILEHLYQTVNWWEWFGAAHFNFKMTIKLWGCCKATLSLTMIDASHSLSECRIRVNSTTNWKL